MAEPKVEVDLAAIRSHHAAYTSLWSEAQRDSRKETFAILAACRSADDVPKLLAAIEALLQPGLWSPVVSDSSEGEPCTS